MAVIRLGIMVIPLAVAFVICLFMAPETKGKSLEEVSSVAAQTPVIGATADVR